MQYTSQQLLQRAAELMACNRPEVAATYLDAVLLREPRRPDVLFDLGRIALRLGDPDRSAHLGRRMLGLSKMQRPDLGHLLVANALRAKGDHLGAIQAYRYAIDRKADNSEAICNCGGSLLDVGQVEAAFDLLRRGAELAPDDAAMLANLGFAAQRLGLVGEAMSALQRAVSRDPTLGGAWMSLGGLMLDALRFPEAAVAFDRARATLADQNAIGVATYNLALVYIAQGFRREALIMLAQALEKAPAFGLAEGAMLYQAQWLAQWDLVDHMAPRVLARMRTSPEMVVEPFAGLAIPGATQLDHRLAGAAYARRIMPPSSPMISRGHRWADGRTRLRVGFVSADFRNHPMGILSGGLLSGLDRQKIEPIAITYGLDVDDRYRRRCLDACEAHLDLNSQLAISDHAAAEAVAALQFDILVDLQCYTSGTRSGFLRYRPAPIQGHYLVYPTSAGTDVYDFTVLDPVIVGESEEEVFQEKLYRFGQSYFPMIEPEHFVGDVCRADEGLPEGATVFVSMNQAYKISREVFSAWCAILARVPDSVLWLRSMPVETMDVLRRTMASFGLDPARIVFAPEVQPNQHRARLRLADIGLDTWPYGSHTTAMDLLSAGVPMVTIAGPTHPMRVGASMLKAFRLGELVTTTVEEFVDTASRLAVEPAFASPVRDRLANASARDAVASRLAGQAREFGQILGQVRADFSNWS